MGLKEQLDKVGYDTSTLDEAAVLKQLEDAGYDVSSFAPSEPTMAGMAVDAIKRLLPSQETLEAPMKASEKLGKMVEAGGSGIAELNKAILPRIANKIPAVAIAQGLGAPKLHEPAFQPTLNQAAQNVTDVLADREPTTGAGKAGKFIGSFFTPNQIAMTATGEAVAAPIVKGLGKGINAVGKLLAPASEEAIPGAAKAVGNALSTVGGVETPALETVMSSGSKAVKAAKTFPQLAEDVAGSMNKLTQHIDELEKAADTALDAKKVLNTQIMKDAVQTQIAEIKNANVVTPEMEKAQEVLQGMLDKLKGKETMTQPEVAKWVKEVQGVVKKWSGQGNDLTEALKPVQNTVNDALKAQNPKYGESMEKFAEAVNLKKDLADAMGMDVTKGKFSPENVSVTKLKGLLNPDSMLNTKKLLGRFSQVPGVPNYVNLAKESAAKAATSQGVRSRLAGFLAGLVPGGMKATGTAARGAIKGLPVAGNAVYQGLSGE